MDSLHRERLTATFTIDVLVKSKLLELKMLKVCRQSPEIHLKPPARHNKSQELSSTNPWHISKYELSLRALTEESGWLAAGKAHGPLLQHPLVSEPLRDWS